MRNTLKKVQERAASVGLFVQSFGGWYKVLTSNVDYFAAATSETVLRTTKLSDVAMFLSGVESLAARPAKGFQVKAVGESPDVSHWDTEFYALEAVRRSLNEGAEFVVVTKAPNA